MKIKDLMIGDWVRIKLTQVDTRVYSIDSVASLVTVHHALALRPQKIEPIPLTSEILEKNGFEEWDGWRIFDIEDTGVEIGWCGTILKIGGECGNLELPSVMYVHELQHVLKLCGIEKEITL